MKNFVKWYAVAFFLMSSFVMFADGSDENSPQNTSGNGQTVDGEEAPINTQLIYLGIVGVVFAYGFYKNNAKKTA